MNFIDDATCIRTCCALKASAKVPSSLSSLMKPLFFLIYNMQADEEPVDPIKDVRTECYKSCPKQQKLYDACVQRITDKKEGDCEAWFIELLTCADKCVAPKIFKLTKE